MHQALKMAIHKSIEGASSTSVSLDIGHASAPNLMPGMTCDHATSGQLRSSCGFHICMENYDPFKVVLGYWTC